MSMTLHDLINSEFIGVGKYRNKLKKNVRSEKPMILTSRGKPIQVLVPYKMMVDMLSRVDAEVDADA